MGHLLNKPEIEKIAGKEDYFEELYSIMQEYTGLQNNSPENKEILNRWARTLFAFFSIGHANKLKQELVFKEFADYLNTLKNHYQLALITTQPQDTIKPILSAVGYENLFDYIYESGFYEKPDKSKSLERFVNENGKPLFYIGNSKEDVDACKKLNIPSIIVRWDKSDLQVEYRKKSEGDYIVENVEELKQIIENPETMSRIKNH